MLADRLGVQHRDARLAIDLHAHRDRAMQQCRLRLPSAQFGQYALRLAQRIAVQDGRFAAFGAFAAPGRNIGRDLGGVGPAIHRQAEGRLGDEGVAGHHFERLAGGIGLALVVAGGDPDLAIHLDAHLRRPQHVSGRMQRHACTPQLKRFTIRMRVIDLVAQAPLQDGQALARAVVLAHAAAGVVAVTMRNHRARHRPPRVDMEIALRAIEALRPEYHQIAACVRCLVVAVAHAATLAKPVCRS